MSNILYHSAYGGTLVFEPNDSLEHGTIFRDIGGNKDRQKKQDNKLYGPVDEIEKNKKNLQKFQNNREKIILEIKRTADEKIEEFVKNNDINNARDVIVSISRR